MLRSRGVQQASRFLFRRNLATVVAPKTEITELSNGIVVASSPNSHSSTASVGLVLGSGSSAENPYNNGVSNLLGNIFTHSENAAAANKKGLKLNSKVARESQSFFVTSSDGSQLSTSLDFLQKNLIDNHASFPSQIFDSAKQHVLEKVAHFENFKQPARVLEHLHSTAFQNTPLSLPKHGTVESLRDVVQSDLEAFAKQHLKNTNAAVVATGNVNHEELVKAVDTHIKLNSGTKPAITKKSTFLGSEVRLRDDTLPKAWISIAVEGEPLNSPHFYTAQVAAEIFGSYNAFEPSSRLQGIKLLDDIQEYQLCESFDHFSLSYNETGLWGFQTTTSNVNSIDDLLHFTLKQWNRLTVSITDGEVARGKALLKLKLASKQHDSINNAISLGTTVLNNRTKASLDEVFRQIDAITVKDIKEWAGQRLWDQDVAIAGSGQIEGLLDYMRIRNDMSMMRW